MRSCNYLDNNRYVCDDWKSWLGQCSEHNYYMFNVHESNLSKQLMSSETQQYKAK